jgi:deazaflavin-dependent oxidoreductase (nitroreductase family)
MKTALKLIGSAVTLLAAAGLILVAGIRAQSPAVVNGVRRMSRLTKPIVLRTAGTSGSPTAVVRHVGRVTGRHHQTPVVAAAVDDGFVVALPYGPDTNWLKNVRAAGTATILVDGQAREVDNPEIVSIGRRPRISGPASNAFIGSSASGRPSGSARGVDCQRDVARGPRSITEPAVRHWR